MTTHGALRRYAGLLLQSYFNSAMSLWLTLDLAMHAYTGKTSQKLHESCLSLIKQNGTFIC